MFHMFLVIYHQKWTVIHNSQEHDLQNISLKNSSGKKTLYQKCALIMLTNDSYNTPSALLMISLKYT